MECIECGKEFTPEFNRKCCSLDCSLKRANRRHKEYCQQRKIKAEMSNIPDKQTLAVYMGRYKRSASNRNISFELTAKEFITYWKKDCFYCGAISKTVGIDRRDSSIGYTVENCVPCCKTCNMMKLDMNIDVFINYCIKITKRHSN